MDLWHTTYNETREDIFGPAIPLSQLDPAWKPCLWTHYGLRPGQTNASMLPEPATKEQVYVIAKLARDGGKLPAGIEWDIFPNGDVPPNTLVMFDVEHVQNQTGYAKQLATWASAGWVGTRFYVYPMFFPHAPADNQNWGGLNAGAIKNYLKSLDDAAPLAARLNTTYLDCAVLGPGSVPKQIEYWNMQMYGLRARFPKLKVIVQLWGAYHSAMPGNGDHAVLSDLDNDLYAGWVKDSGADGANVWGPRQDSYPKLMQKLAEAVK